VTLEEKKSLKQGTFDTNIVKTKLNPLQKKCCYCMAILYQITNVEIHKNANAFSPSAVVFVKRNGLVTP
jgi:hypothetical protein